MSMSALTEKTSATRLGNFSGVALQGFTTLESKEAAWVSPEGQTHKIVTDKGVCAATNFVGASLS